MFKPEKHDWQFPENKNHGMEAMTNDPMREALASLLDLCETLGDFKNGVTHNGIDEGEVYASGIFDQARKALALPVPVPQDRDAWQSKFSPGDPVEIRIQNSEIDEIIIRRGDVHIEQMSSDSWFMGVNASDGSYWQFWFGARNRKSHVEFRHTETVSAAEQAALKSPPAGEKE